MARCRFCNTSGLQWTSEDGRWVLHNPGSIQNRHNCPLARAFYSSRDDLVVRDTIERYLTAHPGGTTDPTIISSLARGIFVEEISPRPTVNTGPIPAPNEYLGFVGNSIVVIGSNSGPNFNPNVVLGPAVQAVTPMAEEEEEDTPWPWPASPSIPVTTTPQPKVAYQLIWRGTWQGHIAYDKFNLVIWQSTIFKHLGKGQGPTHQGNKWAKLAVGEQDRLLEILTRVEATETPVEQYTRAIKL